MVAKSHDVELDFIRAAAALLVCVGHLRAALFIEYGQITNPSIIDKIFYFITGFGHEAVVIFFILSGYLVGGGVLKKIQYFNMARYVINRLIRLWTVLIPALLFTFFIDHITESCLTDVFSGRYIEKLNSGPDGDYSSSIATFAGNVFFLQTVYVPVFGSNGPLWSLSNEFWYYLLFPAFLFVFVCKGKQRAACLTLFLVVVLIIPPSFYSGFIVWIFGVGVSFFLSKHGRNTRNIYKIIIPIFISMAVLFWSRINSKDGLLAFVADIVVAIPIAWLLYELLASETRFYVFEKYKVLISFFSNISYTLYLFHFPLVFLIFSSFYEGNGLEPDLRGYVCFVLSLMFVVIVSIFFWFMFERNTPKIKFMIDGFLGSKLNEKQ